jgi:hypothetical protein
VRQVVKFRTDPDIPQIAEHRKIGREQQHGKQPPMEISGAVQNDCQ